MSRTHYLISGMRYRIILLGEAQHFENGEIHYRTIAEIEIGQIAPLDVHGIRRTSSERRRQQQQQQQQPPASPGSQPPAQVSPVRRRRVHPYGEGILPVPCPVTPRTSPTPSYILHVPRPLTPQSSPAILPVRHSRPTARMSTSRLPRILRDLHRE